MKKIRIILLSLAVLMPFAALSYAASKGTTGVPFLEMQAGARYIGMGGAGTAIADDSTVMFWNPGLLGKITAHHIDLMHSVYLEDTFYDYASVMYKVTKSQGLGLSVQYFSYGNLDGFDKDSASTGSMNPADLAVAIGYGVNIKGFGIGLSGKFIQSEVTSSAETFALDFGLSFPNLFNDNLYWGVAAANIGSGIKYDKVTEDLPATYRFGAGFYITDYLLAAADLGFVKNRDMYAALGAEYALHLGDAMAAYFRAGYNTVSDTDGITGLTAGFGFGYKTFLINYAFVPFGDLGNTHRLSLTYFWF